MGSLVTKALPLLFFLASFSELYCQRRIIDTWQYELVRSEDFTSSVKSWHFAKEVKTTDSPILAVQDRQIKWLNDVESKTLDLPAGYLRTVFSASGDYFGILSSTESPKLDNRDKMLQLEIYVLSGEKLYTITRQQHYDDSIPAVVISDLDGSAVLGKNSTGTLWFYGRDGELDREVELFLDTPYDLERILQLDLSDDGRRLAVVASKRGASQSGSEAPNPSGEPYLFLFSHSGDEVWRKALPDFNTSATAISDNGDYVIANSYTVDLQGNLTKRTWLFDGNGGTIANFDVLFKYAHFSPDSEFLVLAENTTARVVELSTGRTVWSHNISRKQGMITAVHLADRAEVAVLLVARNEFRDGGFIFSNARLRVLDRSGAVHQEIEIRDEIFKKPALQLSPDHRHITVGFESSYHIYSANR